jgi:hypothetical protein
MKKVKQWVTNEELLLLEEILMQRSEPPSIRWDEEPFDEVIDIRTCDQLPKKVVEREFVIEDDGTVRWL